jgi:hypothetical protein
MKKNEKVKSIEERCSCKKFKKWIKIENDAWIFLSTHDIWYPDDGPIAKYCPFCGKKLKDQI